MAIQFSKSRPGGGAGSRPRPRSERGAAMIIAIAIMTILLAIALTFYTVSRLELQTATNVTSTVRVELMNDAANAIAIAHLNQDFFRNPNATSTDHSWRTIFNGAWAVGKPWARHRSIPLTAGGLPEVNITRFDRAIVGGNDRIYVRFTDGYREPLFRGPRTSDWLFVPRYLGNALANSDIIIYDKTVTFEAEDPNDRYEIEFLSNALQAAGLPGMRFYTDDPREAQQSPARFAYKDEIPFVTPDLFGFVVRGADDPSILQNSVFPVPDPDPSTPGNEEDGYYPQEQIDKWADVDVDGDNLRDAVWIPIPADRFYPNDGVDNDLNGLVDETQDNEIDDDGDGKLNSEFVLLADGSFGAQQTQPDGSPLYDIDEAIEPGIFVYWGGNDGLDNDGDGLADEDDEQQHFLTAPLPGISIPVDLNADGIPGDLVVSSETNTLVPLMVQLPARIIVNVNGAPVTLTEANVDAIDNDYDLIVNDYFTYAYVGPNTGNTFPFQVTGFEILNGEVNTFFRDAVNSVLQRNDPGFSTPFPANYYAAQWRHPGNWAIGFAGANANPTLYSDAELFATARERAYTDINIEQVLDGPLRYQPSNIEFKTLSGDIETRSVASLIGPALRVTHSGEPVCDLVGRAAIYIADEASKVNLNVAGGHQWRGRYDVAAGSNSTMPRARALADGVSPREYDTRVLPAVGAQIADKFDAIKIGSPVIPNPDGGQPAIFSDALTLGVNRQLRRLGDSDERSYVTDRLQNYYYDISAPGYGRTDDNANALLLSLNGIDDDGDGLIDEGVFLPKISDLTRLALSDPPASANAYPNLPPLLQQQVERELFETRYLEYFAQLGIFEGIDEPAELQQFSPLRNLLAEGRRPGYLDVDDADTPLQDNIDNDGDSVTNEFGELGDMMLTGREAINALGEVGDASYSWIKNITTTFSADKSATLLSDREGVRALNRLDFNFARPQQIAAHLLLKNPGIESVTERQWRPDQRQRATGDPLLMWRLQEFRAGRNYTPADRALQNLPRLYAEGLRQADISITAPPLGAGYPASVATTGPLDLPVNTPYTAGGGILHGVHFGGGPLEPATFFLPADPVLRAMQAAVDIVDSRDRDHRPSVLSTEYVDLYGSPEDPVDVYNWPPAPAVKGIVDINEDHLFPLEEIEQKLTQILGGQRTLQTIDRWWQAFVGGDMDGDGVIEDEQRHISYTVRGREAVKINEIMVRPVRRIEAEAVPNSGVPAATAPSFPGALEPMLGVSNPIFFDPTPFGDSADGENTIMPDFAVRRHVLQGNGVGSTSWTLQYASLPPAIDPLGERTVLSAQNIGFNYEIQVLPGVTDEVEIPDALEFIIHATDGLPAGRYYLAANTSDPFGENSVLDEADLEYSIKYIPVDVDGNLLDSTILQRTMQYVSDTAGIYDQYVDILYTQNRWSKIRDQYISDNVAGAPPGWVFLDGTPYGTVNSGWNSDPLSRDPVNDLQLLDMHQQEGYFLGGDNFDGMGNDWALQAGQPRFSTRTVIVPPYVDPNGRNQRYLNELRAQGATLHTGVAGYVLNIAFRKGPNSDPANALAINFLDFSQEPDHEWVELVNTSDEPVNVAGWRLKVGQVYSEDAPTIDPFRSEWTIPAIHGRSAAAPPLGPFDQTIIAPGGTLLLSFDANLDVSTPPPPYPPQAPSNVLTPFDMFQAATSDFGTYNNGIGLVQRWYDRSWPLIGDLGSGNLNPPANALANDPYDALEFVTVPPIGDVSWSPAFSALRTFFDDATGSVFSRPGIFTGPGPNRTAFAFDYLDTNGDGVSTRNYVLADEAALPDPDTIDSPAEREAYARELAELRFRDTDSVRAHRDAHGDLSFTRIVPLINDILVKQVPGDPVSDGYGLEDTHDPTVLAALILRGGVFPNYPEQDGIDNDGDGTYEDENSVAVRGILASDMIDNDLDGYIDELDEGVDEGGALITADGFGTPVQWRRWGAGTFESDGGPDGGVLPVIFNRDRAFHEGNVMILPGFLEYVLNGIPATPEAIENAGTLGNPVPSVARLGVPGRYETARGRTFIGYNDLASPETQAAYLGSAYDPPEFQAFAERRFYPGDNVIVTLYDARNEIVDQATYREYDVINRTIDDVMPNPYPDGGLNRDYPSMWLPNHMGLDFYRSLERKHPLYAGDRFGTTNRWQATDGAYDDWSESMSFWERQVLLNDAQNQLPLIADGGPVRPRFVSGPLARDKHNLRLLGHSVFASPLRENFAARRMNNPADGVLVAADLNDLSLAALGSNDEIYTPDSTDQRQDVIDSVPGGLQPSQFPAPEIFTMADGSGPDDFQTLPLAQNKDWTLDPSRAVVRNRPLTSAGDLIGVPAVTFEHQMQNTAHPYFSIPFANRYLHDLTQVNNFFRTVALPNRAPREPEYNAGVSPSFELAFEPALRGGLLGQEPADPVSGDIYLQAAEMSSTESITLTVGQADFVPIRPFPLDLPVGVTPFGDPINFMNYQPGATTAADDWYVPGVWAPVFLFEIPGFDDPSGDGVGFPNYPTYFDGRTLPPNDYQIQPLYLFNHAFLFPGGGAGAFSGASTELYGPPVPNAAGGPYQGMSLTQLGFRWPLEQRAVMYVSQIRDASLSNDVLEAASAAGVPDTAVRPEAIFSWDANDGLENGEYILYIGCEIPRLRETLGTASVVAGNAPVNMSPSSLGPDFGVADLDLLVPPDASGFGARVILDKERTENFNPTIAFDTEIAIDVITDPTRARGISGGPGEPGLVPPEQWRTTPGDVRRPKDGYIFYGNSAAGEWSPQIVRVTNNFLAIRVRNMANTSSTAACITHVVLAPRKRVPGKINVNTVATAEVPATGPNASIQRVEIFNPLMGLPAIVDAPVDSNAPYAPFAPLASTDDVDLLRNTKGIGWWNLFDAAGGTIPGPVGGDTGPVNYADLSDADEDARIRLQMTNMIMQGRPEHPDGRYYTSITELATEAGLYPHPAGGQIHPLSNQSNPTARLDEVFARFRRMSNLITTRSDIFEIQAIVQGGYGLDLDGDGRYNYRSPDEFVITAESKSRLVYERRTPSDRSDEARLE